MQPTSCLCCRQELAEPQPCTHGGPALKCLTSSKSSSGPCHASAKTGAVRPIGPDLLTSTRCRNLGLMQLRPQPPSANAPRQHPEQPQQTPQPTASPPSPAKPPRSASPPPQTLTPRKTRSRRRQRSRQGGGAGRPSQPQSSTFLRMWWPGKLPFPPQGPTGMAARSLCCCGTHTKVLPRQRLPLPELGLGLEGLEERGSC